MIKRDIITVNVSNDGIFADYLGRKIIPAGTELYASDKWITEDRFTPVVATQSDTNYISIGNLANDIDVTEGNVIASVVTRMYDEYDKKCYQQGWVCPKCGGVYSPLQTCCPNCTPAKPIQWTCETGNPNTPTSQSISVSGNGIDTSDRMNNFK